MLWVRLLTISTWGCQSIDGFTSLIVLPLSIGSYQNKSNQKSTSYVPVSSLTLLIELIKKLTFTRLASRTLLAASAFDEEPVAGWTAGVAGGVACVAAMAMACGETKG